jgi:hypothetical protein
MLVFLRAELRHREGRLSDSELGSELRAQLEEEQACLLELISLIRRETTLERTEEVLKSMIAQQQMARRQTRRWQRLAKLTIWRTKRSRERMEYARCGLSGGPLENRPATVQNPKLSRN